VRRVSHKEEERDYILHEEDRECIEKFPDWPPGAKTVNVTAFCH